MGNRRGQVLIENVLMMVLTLSFVMFGLDRLKKDQSLAKLIGGPWTKMNGLIENGVLETPDVARKKHANDLDRKSTYLPTGQ